MCESQMSLVSKSRERLLMNDQKSMMLSPNLHRSREKLYGLRSLSKSHEVLNLCKTVGGLNSEVKVPESSPLRGILKTLTRATTTDISSLVGVEVKEEGSKSSSTSSLHENGNNDSIMEPVGKGLKDSENIEKENLCEKLADTKEMTVPLEVQPLQSVLTFICKNSTSTEPKDESDDKENVAVDNQKDEISTETGNKINISCEDDLKENKKHRPPPLFTKQLSITQSDEEPMSPETNLDSLSLTEGTSTSSSEISEEDAGSLERITYDFSTEDDEPRYTVAQLISAYNLHQEIVTKCSLEVTMSAEDLETKIPPLLEKAPNQKFPTGPNALRLFIPNIDIASRTVKRTARKKPTMRPAPKKIDEDTEENKDTAVNDAEVTTLEPASEDLTETNPSPETKPPKTTKSTVITEKPSISTENKYKLEKSNSKEKCRLTEDVPSRSFVRSSSISSEASFKSSGASSNITTSTEELTGEKKSRSNRSSGIASSDGDHQGETWKSGSSSAGVKASDRLSQTTPRPNRKSFCSPRVPAVQPDSKTRRKSSPIMKPFY